ncbi:LysR family transcriptional regulator [Belnapia sp. T6]|uniref:LysR family transcriptional regulator n=1 Tax=Belnapia mucosa TaxID=2804532 RepID=A0ABS1V4E4_9PROT|nr:LysR substrate-binding domain-containing protein [Belnapia mucosa]MBL6456550.1 LysR family transcriptional regulator [Belnapia mucosa]
MELKQIEVFRAIARHGGFSRAARALGIGQPSLTRSIARLEASLGFALFLRGQGAARLTPEGAAFLREVDRAFIGLDRLRIAAEDIRNFGSGRLRVACLTALSSGLLPRTLRRFLREFPEATVSLQVRPSSTIYEWVATQRCDIGIAAPRTGFAAVEEEVLLALPGVLVVPRGHRLARLRRPAGPADLAGEDFLASALEDGARHATDDAFGAAGLVPRMRLETQYGATLCAMVAAGLGVAVVNPVVAEDHAVLPLVTKPFAPEVLFTSRLLRPRGSMRDRLAEAFATLLREEARETAGRLCPGRHPR